MRAIRLPASAWLACLVSVLIAAAVASADVVFPRTLKRRATAPFYYYNCENLQAVRVGDWKLHLPRTTRQIPWWARKKQRPIDTPQLYNLAKDLAERQDVAAEHPQRVAALMALADEARLRLGEFGVRGSQQRPTGTLFPEVPILSNQAQDWDPLSDAEKGRAKAEFKAVHSANKQTKR